MRERLVTAGLRVTAPRVAVLESIPNGTHRPVDAIAQAVRLRIGSVSTQAIYDVLRALTAAGLLRRIEPAGMPALYENRVADNHHHLICRACGAIEDVDCVAGAAPCLDSFPQPAGFAVDEAEVTFWGICPACTPKPSTD
ncbi:MAG TPA: Fur family transcriptional regulator [Mycobacteriales bacterium]|nr:Fur family transcriptional regulator [Mycobacteriales bacterium]